MSGKAILRAMHVVVAGGGWNTANKQPRLRFHVRNRSCTCRQAEMKQVNKIIKVMLDFIVSTKNVTFFRSDSLTHLLMTHY